MSEGLPAGWEKRVSASRGIPYYFNRETGESRWDPPTGTGDGATISFKSTVHAYHLLVKHAGSRRPSSWREVNITRTSEEALETLQKYESQIRQVPEGEERLATLKRLAREYSDCSSAKAGGDLGEFGKGQMQRPFEEAAFCLPIGGLSTPVSTDSGWHLIYRVA